MVLVLTHERDQNKNPTASPPSGRRASDQQTATRSTSELLLGEHLPEHTKQIKTEIFCQSRSGWWSPISAADCAQEDPAACTSNATRRADRTAPVCVCVHQQHPTRLQAETTHLTVAAFSSISVHMSRCVRTPRNNATLRISADVSLCT